MKDTILNNLYTTAETIDLIKEGLSRDDPGFEDFAPAALQTVYLALIKIAEDIKEKL